MAEFIVFHSVSFREHLREVWKSDKNLFCRLYPVLEKTKCRFPTDVFFLDVIPVIPCKFRPVNFTDGQIKENGQSMVLRKIIQDCYILKSAIFAHNKNTIDDLPENIRPMIRSLEGATLLDKLQSAWTTLQESVDMIVDSDAKNDRSNMSGFKQVRTYLNSSTAILKPASLSISFHSFRSWKRRKACFACT